MKFKYYVYMSEVGEVSAEDLGIPTDVDVAPETGAAAPEPEAESPVGPPTPEDAPDVEVDTKLLAKEVDQLTLTVLATEGSAIVDRVAGKKPEELRQFFIDNPGSLALRDVYFLSKLEDEDLGPNGLPLNSGDAGIVVGDYTVQKIWKSADGVLSCQVEGSDEPVDIQQDDLIAAHILKNEAQILSSLPTEQARTIAKKYIDLHENTPDTLPDDFYDGLPKLVTELAKENGIWTTDDILDATRIHFEQMEIPDGAPAEEIARIEAYNKGAAEQIEIAKEVLKGANLATDEQIEQLMELKGMDEATLAKTLAQAREAVPVIQKAIREAQTDDQRNKLKADLDETQATVQVYAEIQSKMNKNTTKDYVKRQRKGAVSADLGKRHIQAVKDGDMAALVLMISPESSIKATTAEKALARTAHEKYMKNVKTMGMIAALAALLLALGISQGAKA